VRVAGRGWRGSCAGQGQGIVAVVALGDLSIGAVSDSHTGVFHRSSDGQVAGCEAGGGCRPMGCAG